MPHLGVPVPGIVHAGSSEWLSETINRTEKLLMLLITLVLFLLRISAVKRPLGPQALNMYDVFTSCCIFVIKLLKCSSVTCLNHVTVEKS